MSELHHPRRELARAATAAVGVLHPELGEHPPDVGRRQVHEVAAAQGRRDV